MGKPTSGRVFVGGKEIGKDTDFADNIGIIIETPGFLSAYSGYKNLEYLAGIKNIIGEKEIKKSSILWVCVKDLGLHRLLWKIQRS